MTRFILMMLLAGTLAGPLAAQEVVPPEEVLDLLEGRTVDYSIAGSAAGREQFLSRDEVVLRDAAGQCLSGAVTVRGTALCFAYDGDPEPYCWITFRFPDDSLKMRFTSLGDATVLDLTNIDDIPVVCDPVGSV